MSVKLNRPLKPEESQKNLNFNGKTIPYMGFAPGTSGLAVSTESYFACHALINTGLAKLWKSLENNGLLKMVPSNAA
jgi:hypothetical protein